MASGSSEVPQCSEHPSLFEFILVSVLAIKLNGPQAIFQPFDIDQAQFVRVIIFVAFGSELREAVFSRRCLMDIALAFITR